MKKLFMLFLAWCYKQGLRFSQSCYRKGICKVRKVNARVISIGNITWGGTGKTPLTVKLAKDIESYYQKKIAVLTRGYGGDEAGLLQKKLPNIPVIVGRDRVKSALEAIHKHNAEILILDDGFQHIRLERDLDIVLINATAPFGPGPLIPAGTLREPLEHLRRAHIFILTKSDIGSKNLHWIRQKLVSIKPDAVIFEAIHKPLRLTNFKTSRVLGLGEIKGKKMGALSGIADPQSFEKTVEKIGAEILFAARYEDHHRFSEAEIVDFVRRCRSVGVREAVTTEKDYQRLENLLRTSKAEALGNFTFLVLQMEFQINDEENFIRRCVNS